jgi:hypothetical protein
LENDTNRPAERARFSPLTWTLVAALGGVGIYLATWIGPISFYFSFQRPLLAEAAGEKAPPLVFHVPRDVAPEKVAGWSYFGDDKGFGFPLPPGQLTSVNKVGEMYAVRLKEGSYEVQKFDPGFLVFLYHQELTVIGGRTQRGWTDETILTAVMREQPRRYELGWSARERAQYAAKLLCKMLVFENEAAVRVERASREDPAATAVLVEYEDGKAKIVRVDEQGVAVILLPPEAPDSWKISAAAWIKEAPVAAKTGPEAAAEEDV